MWPLIECKRPTRTKGRAVGIIDGSEQRAARVFALGVLHAMARKRGRLTACGGLLGDADELWIPGQVLAETRGLGRGLDEQQWPRRAAFDGAAPRVVDAELLESVAPRPALEVCSLGRGHDGNVGELLELGRASEPRAGELEETLTRQLAHRLLAVLDRLERIQQVRDASVHVADALRGLGLEGQGRLLLFGVLHLEEHRDADCEPRDEDQQFDRAEADRKSVV